MIVLTAARASGAEAGPISYALVVGSSQGGVGQTDLRYAVRDAERMAGLLTELSRYPADNIIILRDPTREMLLSALDQIDSRVGAHHSRGERSRFFFYYSGHARATALNIADEILPLEQLRERLIAIPSTITVVVLDACQSGAFSRVKGAGPTADFSYNTVDRLRTEGIAVMASSTGNELSQESDRLGSSFFTHHLIVALRGVGDLDQDGRVTLSEAYSYAYNRTLVDTSSTAVGGQHATLESELKGTGEVVLSYPARADSQLALDADLLGQVLIYEEDGGGVMAELNKVAEAPMRLALPAGDYVALIRETGRVWRCDLRLKKGEQLSLDLDACKLTAARGMAKGNQERGVDTTPKPKETVRQNARAHPLAETHRINRVLMAKMAHRSPIVAAVLAAVPFPGGLGHLYADSWWPNGAFFTLVQVAETAAVVAMVGNSTLSDGTISMLDNKFGVVPVRGFTDDGLLFAAIGVAALYAATKVWEAVDVYYRVKANNAAQDAAATAPALTVLPQALPTRHGTLYGLAATLEF